MPPLGAPPPPSPRRAATTLLGCVLLTLGAPGLLLSLLGLAKALGAPPGAPLGRDVLVADSALQVLGKCALVALAAAVLARDRRAPAAAWGALALSAAGAVHTLSRVAPGQAAALEGAAAAGYSLGAYAFCLISLLLYAAVILYLRTGAARKELGL